LFLLILPVLAQIRPLIYDYRRGVAGAEITLQDVINENLDQILKTRENLKIERAFISKGKKTEVRLKLTPLKILKNVSLYEEIPKSAAESSDEIIFKTKPTEIINKDPISVWYFAYLDNEKEIKYNVNKSLEEINQEEFKAFAIATEFGEQLAPKRININMILAVALPIIIIASILLFASRTKKPPQPSYTQYPPQYYRR